MFYQWKNKIYAAVEPHLTLPLMGLDISDASVKLLKFNFRDAQVECFGEFTLSDGAIERGVIKDEDKVVKAFQEYFSSHKKHFHPWVSVSLPEESGFLRVVQIPKIKREEMGNAVRWEIEGNIPLPIEELYFDYEIIESESRAQLDHLDVVITAFPKAIIESYTRILKRVGLAPLSLELESQAIIRSILPALGTRAVAVADMGKTRTSLIVFAGGAIRYTTTIDFGGRLLENNIARSMNVSLAEAGELKVKYGLSKTEKEGKLYSDLVPALSALADEFKRMMDYYSHHAEHSHDNAAIEKIFLVGGDANLLGLTAYLSAALKTSVFIVSPLEPLDPGNFFQIPAISRRLSLGYATAIGLALRSH